MEPPRFIWWREADRRYLLWLPLLAALLVVIVGVFFVVFTSARVDGASMAPALLPEDRVLITRGYDVPAVGDIVSAEIVTDRGVESVLKRVIALPGDYVEVRGDVAYVNGAESTAAPAPVVSTSQPAADVFTVPAGHVYVLGDNRPISLDSRFVGPVPIPAITGKVVAIFSPATRWRLVD